MPVSKVDTKAPLTPVERILRESLHPAEFRDVHIYAFSRRTIFSDGSARIDHPLPIVAIGSILKETEHFSKLLTSGFAEANPDSSNAVRQRAHEYEYDYDSDSDLDEFEEPEDIRPPVAGPSHSEKGKNKDESVEEPVASVAKGSNAKADGTKCHTILIPNIAYRTLEACIFYLYTGKVNFLPLASRGPAKRQFAMLTTANTLAPPCSPRSIYRLAESYGMTELQNLAYDEIISQLSPENIVKEAFSSFFARYDRLREHAVSYLSQNYHHPAVQGLLPNVIDSIVQGELLHAGGVLRSLLGLRVAITSGPAPASRPTLPPTAPPIATPQPRVPGVPAGAQPDSPTPDSVPQPGQPPTLQAGFFGLGLWQSASAQNTSATPGMNGSETMSASLGVQTGSTQAQSWLDDPENELDAAAVTRWKTPILVK